jgi:hypothetical protein
MSRDSSEAELGVFNIHRDENGLGHAPIIGTPGIDESLARYFEAIAIAVIVAVICTFSASEHVDRIVVSTQQPVLPEIANLLPRATAIVSGI